MCDEVKVTFKLKYNYNITKMMDNNEIICFMSNDEVYNKVKLQIQIILFGKFPPDSKNMNILPFVIDTPIIDHLNN